MKLAAWHAGTALLVAGCLLASGVLPSSAQETPAPSTTASPRSVPAAPTDIQINLGQGLVSWSDNSTDEDGFKVTISTYKSGSESELYREDHTTGPNVASVQASSVASISTGDSVLVIVVAFNSAGDSPAARVARALEGGLIPPTPVPSAAELPSTGYGDGSTPRSAVYATFGFSLALAAAAMTSLMLAARRRTDRAV